MLSPIPTLFRAWLSVLSRSQWAPWARAHLRKSDSTLPLWLSRTPKCTNTLPAMRARQSGSGSANEQMPPHCVSVTAPMKICHRNAPEDTDQWQGPSCITLRSILLLSQQWSFYMQTLNDMSDFYRKRTFIVVVLYSEDSSPGGTCVIDDGFGIQWFDCEGVNNPDWDPLWKIN